MRKLGAFALLAYLSGLPALAQAPPPVPPIPDVTRSITYNITSSTPQVQVPFPVFGDCSDIQVQINGVSQSLPTTLWNCASASGAALSTLPLPITDMVVNFTPPLTSGSTTITGAWHPRNLTVPTASGLNRHEYEQAISTLIASNREAFDFLAGLGSVAPLTATLDSPPVIGGVAPNAGYFTLAEANVSNFADNARSLQSFGVDMTGATDTTAAFQTALDSGVPLTCVGTFQVSSLVTATNVDASLTGFNSVNGCVMLLTTPQSMVMLTETGNVLRASNKIRLEHIKVKPQAAITNVTGATHTAAFDIEYPLGTSGMVSQNVYVHDIQIEPSANANYILTGLYLNDVQTVHVDDFHMEGRRSAIDQASAAIVIDGTHMPTTFTIEHVEGDFLGYGVYAPQRASGGFQGVRVTKLDCVFCYFGVSLNGSLDGASDFASMTGIEGFYYQAGVAVQNVGDAFISDNYVFLGNPASGTITNPSCFVVAWTITPLINVSPAIIERNHCDGAQASGYTGSKIGVIYGGFSNAILAGDVGTNELTNLDIGVLTPVGTNGVLVAKQAAHSVTTEWSNAAAAGNILPMPPLAVMDGSAQAAGLVGEVIRSNIVAGSAVALTSGTPKTITSVSLTPGDWDCRGDVAFNPNAATTISAVAAGISSTTNVLPLQGTDGSYFISGSLATGVGTSAPLASFQINLAATTTEYLVAFSNFAVNTQSAYGNVECRRMR